MGYRFIKFEQSGTPDKYINMSFVTAVVAPEMSGAEAKIYVSGMPTEVEISYQEWLKLKKYMHRGTQLRKLTALGILLFTGTVVFAGQSIVKIVVLAFGQG